MTYDIGNLGPDVLAPSLRSAEAQPGSHFVQLYDEDSSLVDAVQTFISVGLGRGDAAIVVADESHRMAFEEALGASGIDMQTARAEGHYLSIDADDALSGFMADGIPNSERFAEMFGELLGRAAGDGRKVRVFGEMVALLWATGNVAGAISLEELWNGLAQTHPFQLFCAYPVNAFTGHDLVPLREVCRQHSHVIPPPL